jgi:two-component system nitrogen regulation sensor histidine kinase NtrY
MRPLNYERRIQLLALAAGFPGSLIAMILLWHGNYSSGAVWTLAFLILSLWLGFAFSLRHRVVFSLQTLSNLLAALREEDFSMRARGASTDDAMGEVMIEVNALSEVLREQRLGALEANALLTPAPSCGWSTERANAYWGVPKGVCWGLRRRSLD